MSVKKSIFVMPYYEDNFFYEKVQSEILFSFKKLSYPYKVFQQAAEIYQILKLKNTYLN